MFKILRKAAMVGLGLQARANQVIDEWVKEGEHNQRKEAKWVKDLLDRLEREAEPLDEKLNQVYKKALSLFDIPTREDFNRLSKKVDELLSRLEQAPGTKRG